MVVSEITGGLGNQMFQYAAAKALAARRKTPLLLDTTILKTLNPHATPRSLELDIFDFQLKICSSSVRNRFFSANILKRVLFKGFCSYRIFQEKAFNFKPGLSEQGKNTFLRGYWQSEKYFLPIAAQIRRDFHFQNAGSSMTRNIIEEIVRTNSVAVHIRRGDYVTSTAAGTFHGVLPMGYYENAFKTIESKLGQVIYYVLTDDPQWVKANFSTGERNIFVVDFNKGSDSWQDLLIMSNCKHQIIANSSFSWWGAWLNTNPDKIVISPAKWFADAHQNKLTDDLIPNRWMRI